MKFDDPKRKKYEKYLWRYVGIYRVKAYYDLETNDYPRDHLGNIDESFDDFYIPCKRGLIKHAICDTLSWYTNSTAQGKNVHKKILEIDSKIITDYYETSSDYVIQFHSDDIEKIAEIVTPHTNGKSIRPYSVKNLPKGRYEINEEDELKFINLLKGLEQTEKLIVVNKAISEFDKLFIARRIKEFGKKYDYKAEKRASMLKSKNFIHSVGMWEDFLEIIKKTLDTKQ